MRLLQGGRRQDDARRLRAGGQALGHGRHSRGFLLRPAARGFRAFRADPRNGRQPHADARHRRHPHLLQRSRELHARRPLLSRRGAGTCAAISSPPATIRSASSRPAAPAWRWRNGSTTASRPSTSGKSTSAAPSRSRRTARYLKERVTETLGLLYADHFPYRQMATARGVRRSPLHEHLKARGAVFGEVAGWERANWFASDGQEREYRYSWKRQNWFDNQRDEHLAVRNGVGLFDMTSFGKIRVEGRDALRLPATALRQRHRRRAGQDRLHADAQPARRHRERSDGDAAFGDRFLPGRARRDAAARPRLAAQAPRRRIRRHHRRDGGRERALPDGARSREDADSEGEPERFLQREQSVRHVSGDRDRLRRSRAPTASPMSANSAGSSTSRPTRRRMCSRRSRKPAPISG